MVMPDKYFLRARLWPTVLTSIPVIAIYWYYIRPLIELQLKELPYLPLMSNVTLSAAIVFLLVQINRLISKELFQRAYFKDEQEMPTTNYLLHKDTFFTIETKNMIRDKMTQLFNVSLYTEEQEQRDETGARKQICLAVSQIRALLKGNEMLLRHNTEYGFFRNLLGGCVIAIFSSFIGIWLSYANGFSKGNFYFFLVMAIVYCIPILLSRFLVNRYGAYYAKVLYEQFLSHKI